MTGNNRRSPLAGIDPAVASILSEAEKKRQIQSLPRGQQKRARQQAKRPRVMLDIPEVVQEEIARIAQTEGMSVSAVATLLLADAVRRYHTRRLNLTNVKRMSRSPRYEWALREGVVDSVLKGDIDLTEDSGKVWR